MKNKEKYEGKIIGIGYWSEDECLEPEATLVLDTSKSIRSQSSEAIRIAEIDNIYNLAR